MLVMPGRPLPASRTLGNARRAPSEPALIRRGLKLWAAKDRVGRGTRCGWDNTAPGFSLAENSRWFGRAGSQNFHPLAKKRERGGAPAIRLVFLGGDAPIHHAGSADRSEGD